MAKTSFTEIKLMMAEIVQQKIQTLTLIEAEGSMFLNILILLP